jgi:ABC-type Fe3+/spermidine/putrescine transport system ATPase subunit
MNYFRCMALLTVSGVSKKEKTIFTVKDISFTQNPFQKIAIAGETGSGKTTLLKIIAGLIQPDAGEILFEQKKVRGPNDQLIPGHAGIAYLSQHFELRNNYWVHEILSYANELTQQDADTLYKVCRIDHLLDRRTDQLSGGEKQRIALTRLLIGSPRLLLLDEPFSNLDAVHKGIIKSVINDITATLGISCIMVSHDAPDTLPWADSILVMKDGQLVQQGTPEQIYRQPVNEYSAGLFGEYNLINAEEAAILNPADKPLSIQKKMLLRPEEFFINAGGKGLKSTIQNIQFMGSYYSIEVTTGIQLIKINSSRNVFLPGETVVLSISSGSKHYI